MVINYTNLKTIAMFLLVLALGFTAINQGLGFFYKVHFLKTPCQLCAELNPDVKECVYQKKAIFFSNGEDWEDPFAVNEIKINVTDLNLNT